MPTYPSQPRFGHRNPSFQSSSTSHCSPFSMPYTLFHSFHISQSTRPLQYNQTLIPTPFSLKLGAVPRTGDCRYTRASPEAEASRRNGGDGTSVVDGEARPLAARRKDDENLDQGSALSAEIRELEYGRVYEDGEVPTGSLALRGCFLSYIFSRERLFHC